MLLIGGSADGEHVHYGEEYDKFHIAIPLKMECAVHHGYHTCPELIEETYTIETIRLSNRCCIRIGIHSGLRFEEAIERLLEHYHP